MIIQPEMIIYSDKHFIAVNKPCGIFSQSGRKGEQSVIKLLEPLFGKLYLINRLDAPASGILVLGRNKFATEKIGYQLSINAEKRYLCAVDNKPPKDSDILVDYLFFIGGRINKSSIAPKNSKNTKKAILMYKYLYKTERYHIIEVLLKTGRHHQIRVQLSNIGCHIRGDIKYGAKRTNKGGGISLHAYSLKFNHPVTGTSISLSAQPPENDPLLREAIKHI